MVNCKTVTVSLAMLRDRMMVSLILLC